MQPTRVARLLLLAVCCAALPLARIGLAAQAPSHHGAAPDEVLAAWKTIKPEALSAHIRFLADDLLEGRGTGTRGETLAARYIAAQFEALGLKPAAADGSYFQPVELDGVRVHTARLTWQNTGAPVEFGFEKDFVARGYAARAKVELRAGAVFVGYGIVAPEFGWDDYQKADVRGKVAVMLASEPVSDDTKFFAGKGLTKYYLTETKIREAVRRGAVAVALVAPPEGIMELPWEFLVSGSRFEQMRLERPPDQPEIQAYLLVNHGAGDRLLAAAGRSLVSVRESLDKKTFHPFEIPGQLEIRVEAEVRRVEAQNVVAKLEGSDPVRRQEFVVYTAHYDHLGIGRPVQGETIYHGAVDNASGTAALLEVARAFASLPQPPPRSILFIATTAEEKGLRGAEYYTHHPLEPLRRTAANINIDVVQMLGRFQDVVPLGAEKSSLEEVVRQACAWMDLRVSPDPLPEKGYYYRSDNYRFAEAGVPSVSLNGGLEWEGVSPEEARRRSEEWIATRYHKPSDRYDPAFDFVAAKRETELQFALGWIVAQAPAMPAWKPGDEFEAVRKAQLEGRR